jgi:hypothetical protein
MIYVFAIKPVWALEQQTKLWPGIYLQKSLPKTEKWEYLLFTQSRFIDESHPWESTYFEGGLGYFLSKNHSLWAGYRWVGFDFATNFFHEDRFWQQFSWRIRESAQTLIFSRTRMEEIRYSNQSENLYRLRERITLEHLLNYEGKINPYYFDEVFIHANKPSYATRNLISENRLFLGFRYKTSSYTNWEVGYLNQYRFLSAPATPDRMSHILAVTFNIFEI